MIGIKAKRKREGVEVTFVLRTSKILQSVKKAQIILCAIKEKLFRKMRIFYKRQILKSEIILEKTEEKNGISFYKWKENVSGLKNVSINIPLLKVIRRNEL